MARLSKEQLRFNRGGAKHGIPGSSRYKTYVFGHYTNVRKGRFKHAKGKVHNYRRRKAR